MASWCQGEPLVITEVAPVVRFHGLGSVVRAAPDRIQIYPVRQRDRRHHMPAIVKDRRDRHNRCPKGQGGDGFSSFVARRVGACQRVPMCERWPLLMNQTAHSPTQINSTGRHQRLTPHAQTAPK